MNLLRTIWPGLGSRTWRGARERTHTKCGPGRLHLQGKKK